MDHSPPSLAELVNLLFEEIRRPDGKPFTEKEVSEQVLISHKALNHIRTGQTPNPGFLAIREISRFFGISLDFFAVKTRSECYRFLREQQPPSSTPAWVDEITFRSLELSESARQDLLRVIQWVEASERERKAQ